MSEITLDEALAVYARRRSAILARTIEELGRRAVAGFVPPRERKNLAFHRAWLATAADPRLRSWCLPLLGARLPWPADDVLDEDALTQRLDVLQRAAPDPRIAGALISLCESHPLLSHHRHTEQQIVRLLERHAHDGTSEELAARGVELPEDVRIELPAAVAPTPDELARWVIAGPPPARPPRDLAALHRAVLAAPDDDAPRAVLGDALLEAGDPRGELIAIQLAEARGEATDAAIARAQELVKEHGRRWLGTLRSAIYRAELRRGFVYRIELAGTWASRHWDDHLHDPALATVEVLEPGQASGALYARFLASPALVSLRELSVEHDAAWRAVAAAPLPRLERLICVMRRRGNYARLFLEQVLPYIEERPRITTVGCKLYAVHRFSEALRARLRGLYCRDHLAEAVPIWAELPRLRSLICGWPDAVELVRAADGTELVRVHSRALGIWTHDLTVLPEQVRRIEVYGNAKLARALAVQHGDRFEIVARMRSGAIAGA